MPYTVLVFQLYNAYAHSVSNFTKEARLLIISKKTQPSTVQINRLDTLRSAHQSHVLGLVAAFGTCTIASSEQFYQYCSDTDLFIYFNRRNEKKLKGFQHVVYQRVPVQSQYMHTDCSLEIGNSEAPNWSCSSLSGFCIQTQSG